MKFEDIGRLVDIAHEALGGEDTDFMLSVSDGKIAISCRVDDCKWGFHVGEMELWEFIADARSHWEEEHDRQGTSCR